MKFSRIVFYFLPPELRFWARRVFYMPSDVINYLRNGKSKYPAKGLIFTGSGDFEKEGNQIVAELLSKKFVKADSKVLDIGCGIGRIAIPLTDVISLKADGEYHGFDIVERGIKWCKENIKSKYPHFNFLCVPLNNDLYVNNDRKASEFIFPYKENQFDLIISNSVFTHMLPSDLENYLDQISKVLKPGGVVRATFFIIDEESKRLMKSNNGLDFKFNYEDYYLIDDKVKCANVGYSEKYLYSKLKMYGFEMLEINKGYWCGREKKENFQDVVYFSKLTN